MIYRHHQFRYRMAVVAAMDNLISKRRPQPFTRIGLGVLLLGAAAICAAQRLSAPSRVWSVGPLTKAEQVMGFAVGAGGATLTGPHIDSQTGSIFAATRSVVFVGDRLVLASKIGMRQVPDAKIPAQVYQLLSLDTHTGQVKESREITAFGSLPVFATNDAHVIVAGRTVLRLTPDLRTQAFLIITRRGASLEAWRTSLQTDRHSETRRVRDTIS